MAWRKALVLYAIYLAVALAAGGFLIIFSSPLLRFFQPIKGAAGDYRFWLAIAGSVVFWVGLFALMHRLPNPLKRRIITGATFLAGLYYVLEYYLPGHNQVLFFWRPAHGNPFTPLKQSVGYATMVVAGFSFFLAAINLSLVHARNLLRLRSGWYNSLAFFLAFIAMALFGLWSSYAPTARFGGLAVSRWHGYLFQEMYVPLNATMFSVLAFYIATAAFRAFRVRTAEAGFMMTAAFVVMLGQVPVGMWLTSSLPLHGPLSALRVEVMANWLLGVINLAAMRAVLFGVLVGYLAMSLRIWLSLERGAFFEQEL